jgi:hypothetical protein
MAASQGKTFDDILVTCAVQGIPFKFAERGRGKKEVQDVEVGQTWSEVEMSSSINLK